MDSAWEDRFTLSLDAENVRQVIDQAPPAEESTALAQGLEKKAEALPLCLTPMEKVSVVAFRKPVAFRKSVFPC